jgi:hypothetical protein
VNARLKFIKNESFGQVCYLLVANVRYWTALQVEREKLLEFKKMFPICVGLLEEEIEKVSNQIEASGGTVSAQIEEMAPFTANVR